MYIGECACVFVLSTSSLVVFRGPCQGTAAWLRLEPTTGWVRMSGYESSAKIGVLIKIPTTHQDSHKAMLRRAVTAYLEPRSHVIVSQKKSLCLDGLKGEGSISVCQGPKNCCIVHSSASSCETGPVPLAQMSSAASAACPSIESLNSGLAERVSAWILLWHLRSVTLEAARKQLKQLGPGARLAVVERAGIPLAVGTNCRFVL